MGNPGYHNIEPATDSDPGASGQTFYSYRDGQGRSHVVDQIALVPSHARALKKIVLPGTSQEHSLPRSIIAWLPSDVSTRALELLTQSPIIAATAHNTAQTSGSYQPIRRETPPLPYVSIIGMLAGFILAALLLKPFRRVLLKAGLLALGMTLLGGLYLNWMGRHTGWVAADGVVTPSAIIEKATENTELLQKRLQHDKADLEQVHE